MESVIWFDLAKVEIARKNYIKAVKYLKNINYLDESNPYYYYFMGLIFKKKDNIAEAEKYLIKSLELKPDLLEEIRALNNIKTENNEESL